MLDGLLEQFKNKKFLYILRFLLKNLKSSY